MKIELFDTTLRDGTQGEHVTLSARDKLRIARRLDAFGPNAIQEAEQTGAWEILLEQFKSVVILILVAAGVLAGLLGMLTALLTTLNERRREMAILRLMAGGYSNREIARSVFLAEGMLLAYMATGAALVAWQGWEPTMATVRGPFVSEHLPRMFVPAVVAAVIGGFLGSRLGRR